MPVDHAGFELIPALLPAEETEALLRALGTLQLAPMRGGIRGIERRVPAVARLADSPLLLATAQRHLSGAPRLVRSIYFDKSPEHNWFVTWHQDRTVAVSERFEANGWGPWSRKDGTWHVQPPLSVLQDMVAVRVHLDASTRDNGCVKVIPGSHKAGLLTADEIGEWVRKETASYCETPAGGALVMRPHLLHASDKAVLPRRRRVLHFEYSSYRLPDGIEWLHPAASD